MRKLKQWGNALTVSALVLSVLTACSGKSDSLASDKTIADEPKTEATAQTADTGAAADPSGIPGMKNGKYDPPITVTRVVGDLDTKFKDGENWENNGFTKWALDTLGINVKTQWIVNSQNDGFNTKLKLALASGEKMPDILAFRGDKKVLNMLIDSGQFMPIDELFDKYANQIYKDASAKWPSMWYSVTKNGHKYALPILDYSLNAPPVMWIREDWLLKLDMKAPTTLDELEQVMDAFVNRNPDGKKNVYGMTASLKNNWSSWMSDVSFLFGAYGTIPGQWNLDADGQLEYGSVTPGAKQALAKLKDWMAKGYISKEVGTWDEFTASQQFTSGGAGIIFGPHWMPDWPLNTLADNDKNAVYKAYPVPGGPDGKRGVRDNPGAAPYQGWVLINKKAEHPEAYLTYYNYMLDNFADPKAGGPFENGFLEGYDWKMVDGKPSRDNAEGDLVNPLTYSFNWEGARIPDLMIDTLTKLATDAPSTPFENQTAQTRKKQEIEAAPIMKLYEQEKAIYPDRFDGAFTPTMTSKGDMLRQLELDAFTKIVYGDTPLDSFDTFVKKWKETGGDQMTIEANEWYSSVK